MSRWSTQHCEQSEAAIPPILTRATFVYRGQLDVEASRIQFLLAAVCASFDEVDAILLSPGVGATGAEWSSFSRQFPNVRSASCVPAERSSVRKVRRLLRRMFAAEPSSVVAVGFSAGAFLPSRRCVAWCVNGIPEERLLHGRTLKNRLLVRVDWWAARRVRAAHTIVVSEPMARLVRRRLGGATAVVPNAVDRTVFHLDSDTAPVYLTYEGGGSPWQGLGQLSAIWQELHRIDSGLRFRVITQDDRAKALAEGIAPSSVEVFSTDDHHRVAAYLNEARLGFLVRAPHIVNEVAWPMKLGEYLACGSPVVVSRCGWDAEAVIERHVAGLVIEWAEPAAVSAAKVAEYLRAIGSDRPPGVERAAAELDGLRWSRVLSDMLRATVGATSPKGGVGGA